MGLLTALPAEAVLLVLRHLDATSLLKVRLICHELKHLSDEPVLWRKLCKETSRIVGDLTRYAVQKYVRNAKSWKLAYFWIKQDDLATFPSDIKLIEHATSIEKDSLKKFYIFARGTEYLFPKSPSIFREFAEFILERPDVDGSWEMAQKFFKTSLLLSNIYLYGPNEKLSVSLDSQDFIRELFPRSIKNDSSDNDTQEREQIRNTFTWALFRFAHYLTNHLHAYKDADTCYKVLFKVLPNNTYILERYAEFLTEHLQKYDLANKIYRLLLGGHANGNTVANYALFEWHIKRNYTLAAHCFKIAIQLTPDKAYYYANFLGRHVKDEEAAKEMLLKSKLFEFVQDSPQETDIFSLALAFHQIHCVDEAEELYRKHLESGKNAYSLSNLAELLVHSRRNFQEAEQLYLAGLELNSARETMEVALAGLRLAQGREGALQELEGLLNASHVKFSRNTYTEAWILYFIHCLQPQKLQALTIVKKQLVTLRIRPKLILMFDANLEWARKNNVLNWQWMYKLTAVYNCEAEIEELDAWNDWASISVPNPPVDTSGSEELPIEEEDEED